jgi:hypothetical protein
MFRSLLARVKRFFAPANKVRRSPSTHLDLECLEGRELLSNNPVQWVPWVPSPSERTFRGHYTKAKPPSPSDYTVWIEWGDGKENIYSGSSVRLQPKATNEFIVETGSHIYETAGNQHGGKYRMTVRNNRDDIWWLQLNHGVSVLAPPSFTSTRPTVRTVGNTVTAKYGDLVLSGSRTDVTETTCWLNHYASKYAPFRALLNRIVNDRDPAHQVNLTVGRDQQFNFPDGRREGVLVDSFFGPGQPIDLHDLELEPSAPLSPGNNSTTIGEDLMHIVAERYYYATDTRAYPPSTTSTEERRFLQAHDNAIVFSNGYRHSLGQSDLLMNILLTTPNPNVAVARSWFGDQTHQDTFFNPMTGIIFQIQAPTR